MEDLIKKYTQAFNALDASAISQLYRIPCAISDADGVQTFTDAQTLLAKFKANCEALKSVGYQSARFNILDFASLGDNKGSITVGWRVMLKETSLEFRSLYICHKIADNWCIFSANVYEGSFD